MTGFGPPGPWKAGVSSGKLITVAEGCNAIRTVSGRSVSVSLMLYNPDGKYSVRYFAIAFLSAAVLSVFASPIIPRVLTLTQDSHSGRAGMSVFIGSGSELISSAI